MLSDDLTVRLWDAVTGELQRILVGHESRLSAGCFSRDGKTLVTGDRAGAIKLWGVDLGQELLTLDGAPGLVKGLRFRGDDKLLAIIADDTRRSRARLCAWSTARFGNADGLDAESLMRAEARWGQAEGSSE